MDRRRDVIGEVGFDPLAALARDPKLAAQQGLRGRRTQADEHARTHDGELRFEPRAAGGELAPARLRVDAALAPRLPLEVLDRVRDVRCPTIDAGKVEGVVEDAAGRPDERRALASV